MIGYKQPLGMHMLGHKTPLGKAMLGHKEPLAHLAKVAILTQELAEKKKTGGLERAIRGVGWKMGQYA